MFDGAIEEGGGKLTYMLAYLRFVWRAYIVHKNTTPHTHTRMHAHRITQHFHQSSSLCAQALFFVCNSRTRARAHPDASCPSSPLQSCVCVYVCVCTCVCIYLSVYASVNTCERSIRHTCRCRARRAGVGNICTYRLRPTVCCDDASIKRGRF